MRIIDGLRSFKEGLQFKLLWEYLLAFKATAWEIFWGASMAGIIFGLCTLEWAPSKTVLLLYLLLVTFMAGYAMWKADHIRLMPKLKVTEFKIERTNTSDPAESRTYVQLCPRCLGDAPVIGCEGRLLRVHEFDYETKQWRPTAMDEAIDLEWSIYEFGPQTIQPGAEPRLNVCYVTFPNRWKSRKLVPTISRQLVRWKDVFDSSDGKFKFDIRITSNNCVPVDVSVIVSLEGHIWDSPKIQLS
jgi:hypothetical protein